MKSVTSRCSIKLLWGSAGSKWRCFTALLLAGILFSSSASACQICVPLPQKTFADRLLEADTVVLAREDTGRPYHFVAVEVLKGDSGEAPIDAFLNTQARRTLAAYPERAMVLTRGRGDEEWKTLGIADTEVASVVRRIIKHADSWSPLETNNTQRLAEFAPLLGHDNRLLHELAYLEIGRAPYGTIRDLAAQISVDTVRTILNNPSYMEWRSLAILLLAQSQKPADKLRIRKTFDDKQGFGSTLNLAAWTTAYIAVDGNRAISRIEQLYLSNPNRSPEELSAVIKALSVQANNDPGLRNPIASAYGTLLEAHPELANEITRDLIAWRRWDFVEQVRRAKALKQGTDPLGTYALNRYLNMAAAAQKGYNFGGPDNREASILPPGSEN